MPTPTLSSDPSGLRSFDNVDDSRHAIYDKVFDTVSNLPPISNDKNTLRLTNTQWVEPDVTSKRQRKEAILGGGTLGRRIRGTWELTDNASGKVIDKHQMSILKVPQLSDGGTFVHNGTEYVLRNQMRMRSGVFTRVKQNGETEAHANTLRGGPAHRYWLDPDKGIFYVKAGQANIPLLPLLQHLGANEKEIRQAWGDDLYARNYQKADGSATGKLVTHFLRGKLNDKPPSQAIKDAFEGMTLDPQVTAKTMSRPFERLDKDAVLDISHKLLAVSRGEKEPDDRDSLAYQTFLGPEDIFAERLAKDREGVRRGLLYKATRTGHVQDFPSSALQNQIDSALLESGLAVATDETNPLEILDKNAQLTHMGEGGIGSTDAIPDSARDVQSSHLGFLDAWRTPESDRVGIDVYLGHQTRKGPDGKLYSRFKDTRTGQAVWKTPQEIAESTVAFPGGFNIPGRHMPAMKNGEMTWVRKNEAQLALPEADQAFSHIGNMVPFKSMLKGQRVAMAARMLTQALPLTNGEAPLVQNAITGTRGAKSYDEEYGRHLGAIKADQGGRVVSASPQQLIVKYDNGKMARIELHDQLPYNRRTFLTQTSSLRPGERFGPGQVIAKSNFTDANGTSAVGLNARVAYIPWGGLNHEDATVVSESLAKKFSSIHAYQHQLEVNDRTRTGLSNYVSLFPGKYQKATLANMDKGGLIKPGTTVSYGDPLILGAEQNERTQNKIHKRGSPGFKDVSVTWDHQDPGVVTDVVNSKSGPVVVVKSVHPLQVGDKLSDRFGSKGVVAQIIPDHQMPADAQGKPFEILMNPLGTVSRGNPGRLVEGALGKIAARLGRPTKIEDFDPAVPDRAAWAQQQLKAHGIPDTEDLVDPVRGVKIPKVATGVQFFMKLHHLAESKGQGRSGGDYTADQQPAKGGEHGSKRLAMQDLSALLSHGSYNVLRDAIAVRGQRNDDYWMQFMQGNMPSKPNVPFVYNKFINSLKASGINVVPQGSQLHLMALTDKDIDKLAGGREIKTGDTVDFDKDLTPIKGGLFSPETAGGHHSSNWTKIPLAEPMPSPVFEEPIRKLLGLTQKKFESVLAGKEPLGDGQGTGPGAIAEALKNINIDRELAVSRAKIQYGNKGERDDAIRKLGYLKSSKQIGVHPGEWVLHSVPVLPTQFRPINVLSGSNKVPLVSDSNLLYRELIEANNNLKEAKKSVGDEGAANERLAVYKAFKGVTGLGEPVTRANKEKNIKGILASVLGSSPKFSTVQRQLLSTTVDNVGRAVIAPNPDLDMDTVGLPENRAFDVYSRVVVRRLKRAGMPVTHAMREVKEHTPLARKVLLEEMSKRPVLVNRAPVLHRFGLMAFKPVLVKGDVLQVSPLVCRGFGADFDGNCVTGDTRVCLQVNQGDLKRSADAETFAIWRKFLAARSDTVTREGDCLLLTLPIGDFPRTGQPMKDKHGADVFPVPGGVRVLSYAHQYGAKVYADISHFTVEGQQDCFRVMTRRHSVDVSGNESLVYFDTADGQLKRCAPADCIDKIVPVISRVSEGEAKLTLRFDIVPVTRRMAVAWVKYATRTDDSSLRSAHRARSQGYVSRPIANKFLTKRLRGVSAAELEACRQIVACREITWDVYVKVKKLPDRQDVFDFDVPSTKIFAVNNGLIVYDTMQYHVPTDEKAKDEALERMLPSKQLLSPGDFKSPMYTPTQEFVGGTFAATDPRFTSKRPVRTFRNTEDMRRAWKAGEIGINDSVRILQK